MKRTKKYPPWLTTVAKKFWRKLAPTLTEQGLLRKETEELFASGCEAYANFRLALDNCHRQGRVITTSTGAIKPNPWVAIERNAWDTFVRCWKQLGIKGNPTAPPLDDLDEFLEDGPTR